MSENKTVLNEEVFLPSRGIIYPKELNVPESLIVCPFKTKDLKGLFGSNTLSSINTLIEKCIVGNLKIKSEDLHIEDRTALFMRIRAITLGSNYVVKRECADCHKTFDVTWDLNNIECEFLDLDEYPIMVTLPNSKKQIGFGFVFTNDFKEIQDLIEKRKKRFPDADFNENDEFAFYYIASAIKIIDNVIPSLESKIEFILTLHPDDYSYLQFLDSSISFGIKNKRIVECPHCKAQTLATLSITEQFFRNSYELPAGIRVSKGVLGRNPAETV